VPEHERGASRTSFQSANRKKQRLVQKRKARAAVAKPSRAGCSDGARCGGADWSGVDGTRGIQVSGEEPGFFEDAMIERAEELGRKNLRGNYRGILRTAVKDAGRNRRASEGDALL